MATIVSQHGCLPGRSLGFFENYILSELQQIFLNLVENMCLQLQIGT